MSPPAGARLAALWSRLRPWRPRRHVAHYEPVPPALDDCGARDWSDLTQRMHYIVHLFRVFHERAELDGAPFTEAQVEAIRSGVVPGGEL